MSSPARPVVVVGMHRSGTSLTASLLGSAGLHLGERLMPATEWNAEGYFEDLDFAALHRAALEGLGHDPDGWDEVVLDEMPGNLPERACSLVATRSARSLWGWKDPRTTLFLPFWERLLPEARFVFVYRKPWEVIDSLYRRGDHRLRHDPAAAARLWCHYNRAILDALARVGTRGLLFDLDDVVADPGACVERVGRVFGLPLRPPAAVVKPALLRRGESLADWRALAESILSAEMSVLRRLEAAARPAARSRAPEKPPPSTPPEALLRRWAALRGAEQALAELGASDARGPRVAHLQLFTPVRGRYSETHSFVESLDVDGAARDYSFAIDYDGSAPLRFDAGESVGIVELAALAVRATHAAAAVSWSGSSLGTAPFRLANAVRISSSDEQSFCFLSLNDDPQLHVELPERERFAGRCRVDITVGFRSLSTSPWLRAADLLTGGGRDGASPVRLPETAGAGNDAPVVASEAALAQRRDREARQGLELASLHEALARSARRLAEMSRAAEVRRQRRVFGPWRLVRSIARAFRPRPKV